MSKSNQLVTTLLFFLICIFIIGIIVAFMLYQNKDTVNENEKSIYKLVMMTSSIVIVGLILLIFKISS